MPESGDAGCVLGFDFGNKRIGVAVGLALTGSASPLQVINNQPGTLWDSINRLIDEWQPRALVVGLPLSMQGEETEMCAQCRKFAQRLHGRLGLPVYLQDERLSSRAAGSRFAAQRSAGLKKRKHAANNDSLAAQVLLEDWLGFAESNPEQLVTV